MKPEWSNVWRLSVIQIVLLLCLIFLLEGHLFIGHEFSTWDSIFYGLALYEITKVPALLIEAFISAFSD